MTQMTDQEILQKAIKKAVKNGWDYKYRGFNYAYDSLSKHPYTLEGFIFSHDFAKAFFNGTGFGVATDEFQSKMSKLGWRWHLQQMVLEENPIKYLEKYL